MKNYTQFALIAGVVVLLSIGFYAIAKNGDDPGSGSVQTVTVPTKRSEILQVQADDTVRGDRNAPIAIINYSDYQCPYCVKYDETLKQVIEAYSTQVKWVYREFPLPSHVAAKQASIAALAAGKQGKYWEMSDKLVENSQPDGRGLSESDLTKYAREIGLDIERWRRDLLDKAIPAKIDYDLKTGEALKIRGTPASFLVNKDGTVDELPGAMSFDELKIKIDVALAK